MIDPEKQDQIPDSNLTKPVLGEPRDTQPNPKPETPPAIIGSPSSTQERGIRGRGKVDRKKQDNSVMLLLILILGIVFVLAPLLFKLWEVRPIPPQDTRVGTLTWLLEFGYTFFLELGIGLLVACVIAVTIEKYLRTKSEIRHSEHIRQIKKETLKALFNIHMERPLYKALIRAISKWEIRREDFTVMYQFEPDTNNDDYLKIGVTVSYKLRNVSEKPMRHTVRHRIEDCLGLMDKTAWRAFKIKGCETEGKLQDLALKGAALEDRVERDGIRLRVTFEIKLSPNQIADIEFQYVATKRRTDNDFWLSNIPANGIHFIAMLDRDIPNLQFNVDSFHWEPPILVRSSTHQDSQYHEWKLDHVILPRQGYILFWHQLSPELAATARAQSVDALEER
jgi:hypothetical protein